MPLHPSVVSYFVNNNTHGHDSILTRLLTPGFQHLERFICVLWVSLPSLRIVYQHLIDPCLYGLTGLVTSTGTPVSSKPLTHSASPSNAAAMSLISYTDNTTIMMLPVATKATDNSFRYGNLSCHSIRNLVDAFISHLRDETYGAEYLSLLS